MKLRLVEDWKQSWRWLSVQLGVGAGALSAAIIGAAPGLALQALTLPVGARILVAGMVGAAVIVLPWFTRVLKQGGGNDPAA
jgi:hypothetical protein